jgi:small subunit ribosomal protein S6
MLYELIAVVSIFLVAFVQTYLRHRTNVLRSVQAASTRFGSTSLIPPHPSFRKNTSILLSILERFAQSTGSKLTVNRIARNAGIQVLRSGGVVRGYTNWGTFRLPKPTTKHQARYTDGHHFIMRFDASGAVQSAVRRTLGLDPRMIRFSVVKLGDKLEEIKDVEGKAEWTNARKLADSI